VLGQQGLDRAAQQRREMAGQRRHHQHAGCGAIGVAFWKCSSVPNGVTSAARSVTATSSSPILARWAG
jgi:hypothetical protein